MLQNTYNRYAPWPLSTEEALVETRAFSFPGNCMSDVKKVGRPTSFNELVRGKVIDLFKSGKTLQEIADILEIPRSTIQYWKSTKQDFLIAVNEAEDFATSLVEGSILLSAQGHTRVQEVPVRHRDGTIEVVKINKYFPPNAAAQALWVKAHNTKYQDKSNVEHSGTVNHAHTVEVAERRTRIKQMMRNPETVEALKVLRDKYRGLPSTKVLVDDDVMEAEIVVTSTNNNDTE